MTVVRVSKHVTGYAADVLGGSATVALDGRNALLGLVLAYAALRASQYNGT